MFTKLLELNRIIEGKMVSKGFGLMGSVLPA